MVGGGPVERWKLSLAQSRERRAGVRSARDRRRRRLQFRPRTEALEGLAPCAFICKGRTAAPDRFILDPIRQGLGPTIRIAPRNVPLPTDARKADATARIKANEACGGEDQSNNLPKNPRP